MRTGARHADGRVRALLVKGLDRSNLPFTLELVCDQMRSASDAWHVGAVTGAGHGHPVGDSEDED